MDGFELGRLGFVLGKDFHRGLVASVHDLLGEGLELGLRGHQALESDGVEGVVLGSHVAGSHGGGGIDDGLELSGQRGVSLGVDEELQFSATFPPAGVVIERCHLVEAQLFIVVRTDELGGVQRALFQGLVHVTRRHVLRHHTQLLHGFAEQATTHAELQALEVGHGLDFFAVPATHLGASVASAAALDVVVGVERVHQLAAIAMVHPGIHLAGCQAERHGAAKGEDGVLAGVVVRGGLRHLDRAALQRVHHAEGRHQFTGCMHRHFELAAGQSAYRFRKHFGATENGVQRLGEAGSKAPTHGGLGVNGWGNTCGEHTGNTGLFDDGTTIHVNLS